MVYFFRLAKIKIPAGWGLICKDGFHCDATLTGPHLTSLERGILIDQIQFLHGHVFIRYFRFSGFGFGDEDQDLHQTTYQPFVNKAGERAHPNSDESVMNEEFDAANALFEEILRMAGDGLRNMDRTKRRYNSK